MRERRLKRLLFTIVVVASIMTPAAMARADVGSITTSLYGTPQVSTDATGTLIHDVTPPGGVYFDVALDPGRSYHVVVQGEHRGGSFTLRLLKDGADPSWVPAPSEVGIYDVSATSDLQLLFYRSTAADAEDYLVRSISIQECKGTCGSEAELKAQVLSDTPELSQALAEGDNYQAATLIEHWAAPRTPAAVDNSSELMTYGNLSASTLYYDYFQTGQGGFYCAGTAYFLHMLLDLFAIPNFQLWFGDVSFFTHAVVVEPLTRADGGTDYRLLDPTFDATYTLAGSSTPATIQQMLEAWSTGETDRIEPHFGDLSQRPVEESPYQDGSYTITTCAAVQSTMCDFGTFTHNWAPIFAEHEYPPGLEGLLQLLALNRLLNTEMLGVPDDFESMQSLFTPDLPGEPEVVTDPEAGGPPPDGSSAPPHVASPSAVEPEHAEPSPTELQRTGGSAHTVVALRLPALRGSGQVGRLLTCATSLSIDGTHVTRYVWLRDGRAISGVTGKRYRATLRDRGRQLRCEIRLKTGATAVALRSKSRLIKARAARRET